MKDLRNLLIDCRIELRKAQRDFQKTRLCEQLDAAIQEMAHSINRTAVPDTAGPVGSDTGSSLPAQAVPEKAETSQQVALAWQAAARDLKFSDPALYESLSQRVMAKLESKHLVDQVTELRDLEQSLATAKTQQEDTLAAHYATIAQRDALLGALATAVPQLRDGGDPVAVALARLEWLQSQRAQAVAAATAASAAPIDTESHVPTDIVLRAVLAGARVLTREQREWCVGEAMVTTGFQFTPVELIDKGDAYLAGLALNGSSAQAG
jgi:hypothetical protein